MAQAARTQQAKVHAVSLEQVVDARGGALKPFVGGVFANRATVAAHGDVAGTQAARAKDSIALAGQVSHSPSGEPTVRVQRGGMSAPRYSVLEAAQLAPAAARFYDMAGAEALPFVAGAASFRPAPPWARRWWLRPRRHVSLAPLRASGRHSTWGELRGGAAAAGMSPVARVLGGGREIPGGFALASLQAGPSTFAGASAQAAAAPGRAPSGATWRLAIDGGSDLPLGATFSRYEAFAGGRAVQATSDMRATRSEFRPVIAGGTGGERPSELAQAVDGLVWVTLPNDVAAVQAPSTDEMGLAAVPSRRAAMVPAGLAFQSIAGVVAGARRAAGAVGSTAQVGRGLVGPRGELLAGGDVGVSAGGQVAAGALGRTTSGASTAAAVASQARVDVGTAGGAERYAAEPGVLASAAGGLTGRSMAGATYDGATFAQALRSGFLGNVEASGARAAQLGSVQSPALAAVAARGEAEGSIAGRWVEAALRGNALERGLRAARFLDGMVGEGNYGRIESERQLLAMVREPSVAEAVSGQEVGAEAPRAGRLAARRLAPVAVGRAGGVQSMLGRAEMKPASVRAPQPGRPLVASSDVQRAQVAGVAATERGSVQLGGPDVRLSDARVWRCRAGS